MANHSTVLGRTRPSASVANPALDQPLRSPGGEHGQDLVGYVVLIALIALALFAALIFFSDELGMIFSEVTNILDDKLPA